MLEKNEYKIVKKIKFLKNLRKSPKLIKVLKTFAFVHTYHTQIQDFLTHIKKII